MGSFQAKGTNMKTKCKDERDVKTLREKVRLHKEEMKIESQTYEQQVIVFALKEAEWKRERKRLQDELKKLEVKQEEIKRFMEHEELVGGKDENDKKMFENSYVRECIREERSRRDEAVDKWKRLYLAIKTELDHLIKMTHQEERMARRLEETNLMNELHRELQVKEDTIEQLGEQYALKEKENLRLEREVDILKQSLRITTHKGKKMSKCLKKSQAKQNKI